MKELLLFDMDGTLIDSDLMLVHTWEELYDAFRPGYRPHLKDILRFSGPPLKDSLLQEFPDRPYEETKAYWFSHCGKHYDRFVTSFQGEREALLSLKKKGYRLGILTNKAHSFAEYSLKLTNLEGIFDLLIGEEDVSHLKPDPEGILKAMEYFGEKDKKKVIYIGDTSFDYLAAKNAGVFFLFASFCLRNAPKGVEEKDTLHSYLDLDWRFE